MTHQPQRKGLIARIEPRWRIEAVSTKDAENPDFIEALIDNLHHPDPAIRNKSVLRLMEVGSPAIPALITALRSPEPSVWTLAAGIAVKIGAPAVQPLLDALQAKRESEAVQILIVEILGQIGDIRAIDALIQTLESESSLLQTVAALALTRIGEVAVEPLLKAVSDTQSAVIRQYATSILEHIGTPEAWAAVKAWRAIDDMLG